MVITFAAGCLNNSIPVPRGKDFGGRTAGKILQRRGARVRVGLIVLLLARSATRGNRIGHEPRPRNSLAAIDADAIGTGLQPSARALDLKYFGIEIASILHPACHRVAGDEVRAEDLCQSPLRRPTP